MSDDYSVYEDLMYKWKREGLGKGLLSLFKEKSKGKQIGKDYPEDYWLVYLSVLSEEKKIVGFHRLLKQYIRCYGTGNIHKYLDVARRVRRKDCELRDECRFIYREIKKTRINDELKKLLDGRTVALVGDSDGELGKNKGSEIDDHDIVIRFNNYRISGYSDDYGSKTDIWVRNLEDSVPDKPSEKFDLIVYSADLLHYPLKERIIRGIYRSLKDGVKVTSFETDSYMFLKEKGLPWPSSGASIIASIYLALNDMNNVDFYGFSFLEENPTFHHYFGKDEDYRSKMMADHNMIKEMEVLKELTGRQ